jgi:hypothetical protein
MPPVLEPVPMWGVLGYPLETVAPVVLLLTLPAPVVFLLVWAAVDALRN